jgi:hypothetical protein
MGDNTFPPARVANYLAQQNPNYGLYNARGQFYFNPVLGISSEYVSPATLPNYPLDQGANVSEIVRNTQNISIFNALNAQAQQVKCGIRSQNGPIFSSYRELMAYTQAQYAQAIPGTTSSPTYSINTLFNPQQTCVTYSTILSIDCSGTNFATPSTSITRTNVAFASTSNVILQLVNLANIGAVNSIRFTITGYNFANTIIKIENRVQPTIFSSGSPTVITLSPIVGQLLSYSLIQLILPSNATVFTSVVISS